jgi:hypothetical protein
MQRKRKKVVGFRGHTGGINKVLAASFRKPTHGPQKKKRTIQPAEDAVDDTVKPQYTYSSMYVLLICVF